MEACGRVGYEYPVITEMDDCNSSIQICGEIGKIYDVEKRNDDLICKLWGCDLMIQFDKLDNGTYFLPCLIKWWEETFPSRKHYFRNIENVVNVFHRITSFIGDRDIIGLKLSCDIFPQNVELVAITNDKISIKVHYIDSVDVFVKNIGKIRVSVVYIDSEISLTMDEAFVLPSSNYLISCDDLDFFNIIEKIFIQVNEYQSLFKQTVSNKSCVEKDEKQEGPTKQENVLPHEVEKIKRKRIRKNRKNKKKGVKTSYLI